MNSATNGFAVEITGTEKHCPAGEKAGNRYIQEGKIPVLSCEGPCIRGEIARVAAHMVAKEEPFRRGCHGELITVPGSAVAQWIKTAEKVVLIDGCFLRCHGRVLENIINRENLVQFDAHSFYRKYNDNFDIDEIPEAERRAAARLVADAVLAELRTTARRPVPAEAGCGAAAATGKTTGCGCG
jgi:uncharacterized metal-binding protein